MNKKLNCILLIDDDEASNFLTKILLDEACIAEHIKTKQTAKAALHYIKDSAQLNGHLNTLPYPSLIFLDINMPAIDGWEFIEQYAALLKELPSKIVIVMLSTSLNPDDRSRALSIPEIDLFAIKPLTPEILQSVITDFFPQNTWSK